jgi:hypothetical protein
MMQTKTLYSLAVTATVVALAPYVYAQVSQQTLETISTPNKVQTSLGTLEFTDGAPAKKPLRRSTTISTSCMASRRS